MVNVDNAVVGPAALYVGALDAVEPAPTAIGTAPGAGWRNVGGTNDGVSLNWARSYFEIEMDQILDVAGNVLTRRTLTVSTSLAEPTLENLAFALNGSGTVTENAVDGYTEFTPAAGQDNASGYVAIIIDGKAPNGLRRRIIVRKALQLTDVESSYSKDGLTLYPVEFTAHYVGESVLPWAIYDEDPA